MMNLLRPTPSRWGRSLTLCLFFALCATAVFAGEIGITYVKTIGQVWPELPMMTGGGRLSVDEKGYLYAGTPGQNSFLQKISPDGRVVWRADDTHCSYLGTAVDDQYVYGCGIGYYGNRHLLRRKRESGVLAPGWRFMWVKADDVIKDVPSFKLPAALLVDNTYLYVLDAGTGDVRRLHKDTGQEKAFAIPIKVDGALDMTFSAAGTLLVLCNDKAKEPAAKEGPPPALGFVNEYDRATGKLLRSRFISGLRGPAAITVSRQTKAILIAEGGAPDKPVNQVRIFSVAGADTGMTVGRGGEWQGKWAPDAFAFSSGAGDITSDPQGGLWTNCYAHRMNHLGLIVHFSPSLKPDKVFYAAVGSGVLVDSNLNCVVGGTYAFTWEGDLRWTSGLVQTGAPNQFPSTIDYWTVKPVYVDAKQAIMVNIHAPSIFALDAETGEALGKGYGLAPLLGGVAAACTAGNYVFVAGNRGEGIVGTTLDLPPMQKFFAYPAMLKDKPITGISVSDDLQRVYISSGQGESALLHAFAINGEKLWEAKAGAIFTRYKHILLTGNPSGPGYLAVSARDGAVAGLFGNRAIDDRPPLSLISGMAIGRKDGADFLFVAGQQRVLVYRIAVGE